MTGLPAIDTCLTVTLRDLALGRSRSYSAAQWITTQEQLIAFALEEQRRFSGSALTLTGTAEAGTVAVRTEVGVVSNFAWETTAASG